MPKYNFIQNNMTAGELSPKAQGRTDIEQYLQGLEKTKNMVIVPQGGAHRRPGTEFIAEEFTAHNLVDGSQLSGGSPVAIPTTGVRMFPFIFDEFEQYLIILGTTASSNYVAITRPNGTQALFVVDSTALTLAGTEKRFDGYLGQKELDEVQFAQNGDLLFFVHPNHPPFILARTAGGGSSSFTRFEHWHDPSQPGSLLSTSKPFRNFAFEDVNTNSAITVTTAGVSPSFTMTASTAIFTSDHVGSIFKVTDTGGGGLTAVGIITAFTSSTIVSFETLTGPGPIAVGTPDFQFGAWSDENFYPRALCFYEQRIYYGGTIKAPDTVFASRIGNLVELDALGLAQDTGFGTVVNDDPFSFNVASREVNKIQWLDPGKNLNIGSFGREYIARGSSGAMGPLDILVSPETSHGSHFVQPVRIQNALVFVQKSGRKLREFVFSRDEDSFRGIDLTLLADDILRRDNTNNVTLEPIADVMAYQESDNSVLWIKTNDEGLVGMTMDRTVGVTAWHRHVIGGQGTSTADSEVNIKSITVLPSLNLDGRHDDVYLIIERFINSSTVFYLERINREFDEAAHRTNGAVVPFYTDSSILVAMALSTTVTGLDHLEGETVQVVADSLFVGEKTVSSGQITLDNAAERVLVGFKYQSFVKTLKIDQGAAIGSAQGTISRIDRIVTRFVRTVGAKIGATLDNLDNYIFRPASLPLDQPIPFFNGDKKLEFPNGYDRGVQAIVETDIPMPMNVSSVILRGQTYD